MDITSKELKFTAIFSFIIGVVISAIYFNNWQYIGNQYLAIKEKEYEIQNLGEAQFDSFYIDIDYSVLDDGTWIGNIIYNKTHRNFFGDDPIELANRMKVDIHRYKHRQKEKIRLQQTLSKRSTIY